MKYYLKYYVGGFVDSYITEEFDEKSVIPNIMFLDFTAKNYSHIKGKAVNLTYARDAVEYLRLYSICIEYRLPFIKKGDFSEL